MQQPLPGGNGEAISAKDSWQKLPIDTLCKHGLSVSLAAALHGKGIETLGQFTEHQRKHGDYWAKVLDCKIGPEKAGQIADAFVEFWQQHPEYCEEKKAA